MPGTGEQGWMEGHGPGSKEDKPRAEMDQRGGHLRRGGCLGRILGFGDP